MSTMRQRLICWPPEVRKWGVESCVPFPVPVLRGTNGLGADEFIQGQRTHPMQFTSEDPKPNIRGPTQH